jgi:hypothetical protein
MAFVVGAPHLMLHLDALAKKTASAFHNNLKGLVREKRMRR